MHLVQPIDAEQAEALSLRLRKLGHDANNALVPVYASLDLLRLQLGADHTRLAELTARVETLRAVLQHASTPGRRPPTEGASVISDTHVELASRAMATSIALRWRATPDALAAIPLPSSDLAHLLKLLVGNAFEAHLAERTPAVHRWISVAMWCDAGCFQLDVHDNGPGCTRVEAAALGRLQRRGGGHLGLGLPMSAYIAATAGGSLHVESRPADGFRARVRIPLRPSA